MSEYIVWIVIIIAILLNITYNALVIDEARKSNSHNGRSRLVFACISTAVITILLIVAIFSFNYNSSVEKEYFENFLELDNQIKNL